MTYQQIIKKLNFMDKGDRYYGLRPLFESVAQKLTFQDKEELKQLVNAVDDPKIISNYLKGKSIKTESVDDDEYLSINKRPAIRYFDDPVASIDNFNNSLQIDSVGKTLTESTLKDIQASITSSIPSNCKIVADNQKKYVLIETPNGKYTIPLIPTSKKKRKDKKQLRYIKDGTIRKGIIYDASGKEIGPAYYGTARAVNVQVYNKDLTVYSLVNQNQPITFEEFIDGINNDIY